MIVFDIETDGLNPTKIHCLSYSTGGNNVRTLTDYKDMKDFLLNAKYLAGHNIVRYDIPVLERLLDIKIEAKLYDTLAFSWVLYPARKSHGLESHGVDYGIPKPVIKDWENQTLEDYIHRCEEDVKINLKLWHKCITLFNIIYEGDKQLMDRYFQYLTFKMKAAAMAEQVGWRVDVEKATYYRDLLQKVQDEKVAELRDVMPMVPKYEIKTPPKKMYRTGKKNAGELTKAGEEWFMLLEAEGLPADTQEVRAVKTMEEPNPNSPDQVKEWLFSLGWEPCNYKYIREKDGSERTIPQVRYSEPGHPRKGELTDSVTALAEKEPVIEILEGLTVASHRKAIFSSFVNHAEERDGQYYLKATIGGLTNTLRFKHSAPLVNLPGVDAAWGKEIRGCLLAPDGHVLCGADMVSLESTTKRHFIYPYDPDYVEEMSVDGFDEHLDLAVKAGYLSKEDYNYYTTATQEDNRFKQIHKTRKKFKPVNYSSVYGVGKVKLARSTGMSQDEAEKLINAYWERNWAVKKFAEDQKVKTVDKQMWIKNPVNDFWYSLRYDKDRFSTLNQGTGAYCFDTWLAYCMLMGIQVCGQFHDEVISPLPAGKEQYQTDKMKKACQLLNKKLGLNIELDIDIKYGDTYAQVH